MNIDNMTDEEKRVKIAEACGWTCCGHITDHEPHGLRPPLSIEDFTGKQILDYNVPIDSLPDFLEDLNAIHEAEKTLSDEQHSQFRRLLQKITMRDNGFFNDREWISATARQRADAFLKTL